MYTAQPGRTRAPAVIVVAAILLLAALAAVAAGDTYPAIQELRAAGSAPIDDPLGLASAVVVGLLAPLTLLVPIVPVLRSARGARTAVWVVAAVAVLGAAAFLIADGTSRTGERAAQRIPELAALGAVLVAAVLLATPAAGRHFRGLDSVFISYREGDQAVAAQVYDRLRTTLGRRQLFLTTPGHQPAAAFPPDAAQALVRCRVLVAVIGPSWVARSGRLGDPSDQVRWEVETALVRGIEVIPVLVDVELAEDALPAAVSAIAHRTAFGVRSVSLRRDVSPLVSYVRSRLRGELPLGIQSTYGRDSGARTRS